MPRRATTRLFGDREEQVRILFVAANPSDTSRLALGAEYRAIERALRESVSADRVSLLPHFEARAVELSDALQRHRPHVVHFSGHGNADGELLLSDETGRARAAHPEGVAGVFRLLARDLPIRCVVLNACYSEALARKLAAHVDCVIGMADAIGDRAAALFAGAFYSSLGHGRDVQTAFDLALNDVQFVLPVASVVPQLRHRPGVPPGEVRLIRANATETSRVTIVAAALSLLLVGGVMGWNHLQDPPAPSPPLPSPRPAPTPDSRDAGDVVASQRDASATGDRPSPPPSIGSGRSGGVAPRPPLRPSLIPRDIYRM